MGDRFSNDSAIFPVVFDDDWCGEFEPRTAKLVQRERGGHCIVINVINQRAEPQTGDSSRKQIQSIRKILSVSNAITPISGLITRHQTKTISSSGPKSSPMGEL
jgi:hypothetical protein